MALAGVFIFIKMFDDGNPLQIFFACAGIIFSALTGIIFFKQSIITNE